MVMAPGEGNADLKIQVPSSISTCALCQLPQQSHALAMSPSWTLNVAQEAASRPWLVLQLKRHASSLGELTHEESMELGRNLALVARHFEELPGVRQPHIIYLNETIPGHVHFHVTMSVIEDPIVNTGDLFKRNLPQSAQDIPQTVWMPDVPLKKTKSEPSILVRGIVKLSRSLNGLNFLYSGLTRLLMKFGRDPSYAAEIYVPAWFLLEISLFFAVQRFRFLAIGAMLIIGLRMVDIWSMQIGILLDRGSRILRSFERTLVLTVINLFELMVASSICLYEMGLRGSLHLLSEGFSIVTLRGHPMANQWNFILLDFFGTLTALLLITAIGSIVLGKISSEHFDESET